MHLKDQPLLLESAREFQMKERRLQAFKERKARGEPSEETKAKISAGMKKVDAGSTVDAPEIAVEKLVKLGEEDELEIVDEMPPVEEDLWAGMDTSSLAAVRSSGLAAVAKPKAKKKGKPIPGKKDDEDEEGEDDGDTLKGWEDEGDDEEEDEGSDDKEEPDDEEDDEEEEDEEGGEEEKEEDGNNDEEEDDE